MMRPESEQLHGQPAASKAVDLFCMLDNDVVASKRDKPQVS